MKKRLEVKFKVRERCSGEYIAEITVILPIDESGHLHPLLRSDRKFLGETLHSLWGYVGGECRTRDITIKDTDLQTLRQKVKDKINELVRQLREVAEYNRRKGIVEEKIYTYSVADLVVKFYVKIEWDGEYIAMITVMLPADMEGKLHPLLRSDREFLRKKLHSLWGFLGEKFRRSYLMMKDADLQTLRQKVEKEIEELVRQLREIAEYNRRKEIEELMAQLREVAEYRKKEHNAEVYVYYV